MAAPVYSTTVVSPRDPDSYEDWRKAAVTQKASVNRSSARAAIPEDPVVKVSFSLESKADGDQEAVLRHLIVLDAATSETLDQVAQRFPTIFDAGQVPDPDDAKADLNLSALRFDAFQLEIFRKILDNGELDSDVIAFFAFARESEIVDGAGYRDLHPILKIKKSLRAPPGISLSPSIDFRSYRFKSLTADYAPTTSIAIIDDGIAFANAAFRNGAQSRFNFLWLQDLERTNPGSGQIEFGTVLNKNTIDGALAAAETKAGRIDERAVYATVYGAPDPNVLNPMLFAATHGTHIADLAAGDNDAELYGVQLPSQVSADTSGRLLQSYATQAISRVVDAWLENTSTIDDKLIINFSYGFQAGPKDGTTFLEQELSRLVQQFEGRIEVVLPSGNSYEDETHAEFEVGQEGEVLNWQILPDDRTDSFVEIFFPASAEFTLELSSPDGAGTINQSLAPTADPVSNQILYDGDNAIAGMFLRPHDYGQRSVLLAVGLTQARDVANRQSAPVGPWKIRFTTSAKATPVPVRAMVQRDDTLSGFTQGGRQSFFDHPNSYEWSMRTGSYQELQAGGPVKKNGTLSALSGASAVDVIGSAARSNDCTAIEASWYTAAGPIPFGGPAKPMQSVLVDEGHLTPGKYATGVLSGSSALLSGTSVAAPMYIAAMVNGAHAVNLDPAEKARLGHRLGTLTHTPHVGKKLANAARRPCDLQNGPNTNRFAARS